LKLALGDLPQGRTVVEHLGQPIELTRDGPRVTARSLLCSHWGCRVEWRPDLGHYRCFCHEGTFDALGRPRSGPPTQPLRPVSVELVAGAVRVGER
jgi:Rieske Fe-S protein